MLRMIVLIAALVASVPAYAGCVGAAVGEGCIGVPTPREHRYHEHEGAPVVIERQHHDSPVIIERPHDDDDD
jgi:hypothetical protein